MTGLLPSPRPYVGAHNYLPRQIADPPVTGQRGERRRMIMPERQNRRRDRDQDLQIERARTADPDPVSRPGLARFDPLAELTGENSASRDREAPLPASVAHRADKNILLDRRTIGFPGDDPGAPRGRCKRLELGRGAFDRQVVIPPDRSGRCGLRLSVSLKE